MTDTRATESQCQATIVPAARGSITMSAMSGVASVAPGATPADLDHALGKLHPGARLVLHDPPSNRAWWSDLDPITAQCRDIIARCLLVAPWDVEVRIRIDDGELVRVHVGRLPLRHPDELFDGLVRAAATIGHRGWTVRHSVGHGTATLDRGPADPDDINLIVGAIVAHIPIPPSTRTRLDTDRIPVRTYLLPMDIAAGRLEHHADGTVVYDHQMPLPDRHRVVEQLADVVPTHIVSCSGTAVVFEPAGVMEADRRHVREMTGGLILDGSLGTPRCVDDLDDTTYDFDWDDDDE